MDINRVIGKNLLLLRKSKKITQLELAEQLNYSDKTISKWETGESLPSIEILYNLSSFYGVTLDDLTKEDFSAQKTAEQPKKVKDKMFPTHLMITLLALSVVWLVATVLFVSLKLSFGEYFPMVFLWAVPVSCILLIVFNSIWGKPYILFAILTVMIWSTLVCLHLQLIFLTNIWIIYLLGIPLQVAVILWAAMLKKPRKPKKEKQEKQPKLKPAKPEKKLKENKIKTEQTEEIKFSEKVEENEAPPKPKKDDDDDLKTTLY